MNERYLKNAINCNLATLKITQPTLETTKKLKALLHIVVK